jgi:hypothetical protein
METFLPVRIQGGRRGTLDLQLLATDMFPSALGLTLTLQLRRGDPAPPLAGEEHLALRIGGERQPGLYQCAPVADAAGPSKRTLRLEFVRES